MHAKFWEVVHLPEAKQKTLWNQNRKCSTIRIHFRCWSENTVMQNSRKVCQVIFSGQQHIQENTATLKKLFWCTTVNIDVKHLQNSKKLQLAVVGIQRYLIAKILFDVPWLDGCLEVKILMVCVISKLYFQCISLHL